MSSNNQTMSDPMASSDTAVESQNAIIHSELPPEEVAFTSKPVLRVPNLGAVNPDQAWTVSNLAERPFRVATYAWTTSQSIGTDLFRFDFPYDVFASAKDLQFGDQLKHFQYVRGGGKLIIKCSATPHHSGRILISFDPGAARVGSFYRNSNLECVHLDAASSSTVSLEIPYISPKMMLPTSTRGPEGTSSTRYSMMDWCVTGTIAGQIIVPLGIGTGGSASVTVQVYFIPAGVHFADPRYWSSGSGDADGWWYTPPMIGKAQSKTESPVGNNGAVNVSINNTASPTFGTTNVAAPKDPGSAESSKKKKSNGIFGGISDLLGGDIFGGISDFIGGLGGLFGGGGSSAVAEGASEAGELGDMLGLLAFDRPDNPVIPKHDLIRSINPPCYGVGVDSGVRLATYPNSGHLISTDQAGTAEDPMNIHNIISKPGIIQVITGITPDVPVGGSKLIASFDVTPTMCHSVTTSADAPPFIKGTYFTPTNLAYVSRFFRFFRGSIDLTFDVVASQHHSLHLGVVFLPAHSIGNNGPFAPNFEDFLRYPHEVFEVRTGHAFTFNVPYKGLSEWRLVSEYLPPSNPSDETQMFAFERSLGIVFVYQLTTAAVPATAMANYGLIVSAAAGSDFELAIPNVLNSGESLAPMLEGIPQSKVTQKTHSQLEHHSPSDHAHSATHGDGAVQCSAHFLGERFDSLRDLVKRFDAWEEIQAALTPANPFGYLVLPTRPWDISDVSPDSPPLYGRHLTGLDYFSALYAGRSGSVRYKVLTNIPKTVASFMGITALPEGDLTVSPTAAYTATISPTDLYSWAWRAGSDMELPSHSPTMQVTVPYYSQYSFIRNAFIRGIDHDLTEQYPNTSCGEALFQIHIHSPLTTGQVFVLHILKAAGDDICFIGKTAPPIVYRP